MTTEHSSSLARLIEENQPCVALTGAGISTERAAKDSLGKILGAETLSG